MAGALLPGLSSLTGGGDLQAPTTQTITPTATTGAKNFTFGATRGPEIPAWIPWTVAGVFGFLALLTFFLPKKRSA